MIEGAAEEVGVDGLHLSDAERGLDRQRGEDAGSEEAMGCEGEEVGGDACA